MKTDKKQKQIDELTATIHALQDMADHAYSIVQRNEYLKQIKILGEKKRRLMYGRYES